MAYYKWEFEADYTFNEKRFVHQYDEEYDAVKKTRRAGRPASTKEDLLRIKIAALEEEYTKGFRKSIPTILYNPKVKLTLL